MNSKFDTSHLLPVGTILHGTYRIEAHLASGGFGNTYKATHLALDKLVAIKEFFIKGICNREDDTASVTVGVATNQEIFGQQLNKFIKEARRLGEFNHPNIVKVNDLFQENGTAYYVMEFIDGENLAEHLNSSGPFSETETMQIGLQVLTALDVVHKANIWHLDIKPANIMVDKDHNCKLIDFGASKQMKSDGGATTSTATAVAFTPGFAPLEQELQELEEFGPWTDLYALGGTLYNLLTGNKPPRAIAIKRDSSSDKHEALSMEGVSDTTRNLIVNLMAFEKENRLQSVAEAMQMAKTSRKGNEGENEETTRIGSNIEDKFKPQLLQKPKIRFGKLFVFFGGILALAILFYIGTQVYHSIANQQKESTQTNTHENPIVQQIMSNMVFIEGGTFMMGDTSGQDGEADSDEQPLHQVTLSDFYIGKTEVTQELWLAVMGYNPSIFKGNLKRPVENVSWDDCQRFIKKLNELTGKSFRLPTESEWEFAARGGNKSNGYKYSGSNSFDDVAWCSDNSNMTQSVASKAPNELGLFDMSGNVWEWCQDWKGDYESNALIDPTGQNDGFSRADRGGSWHTGAKDCRVSNRGSNSPTSKGEILGLRLALSI